MSTIASHFSKAWQYMRQGRWGELRRKAMGKVTGRNGYQHAVAPAASAAPQSEHERKLSEFIQRVRQGHANRSSDAPPWHALYRKPLYHLGDSGVTSLDGIYSPLYDLIEVDRFVHEQFRSGAEHHAEKYVLHGEYERHLAKAFATVGVKPDVKGLTILDIGSGAGNTVVPLLNMFEDCTLIASDFSTQMLVTLKHMLQHHGMGGRAGLMQLNAEELDYAPNSFDLVIGGAVLHHLFNPEKTVRGCQRILKPGGAAIFFDPFANGNVMMQVLFQSILDQRFERDLPERTQKHLRGFIHTIDIMRGDKRDPKFLKLDDKWLFTREYFQRCGHDAGFSRTIVYPLQHVPTMFEDHARVVLETYCELPPEMWPEWARQVVREFDAKIPESIKSNLLIEGATIFVK